MWMSVGRTLVLPVSRDRRERGMLYPTLTDLPIVVSYAVVFALTKTRKALQKDRSVFFRRTRGPEPPPEAPYVHRPHLLSPRRAGGVKGGAVQPPRTARAPRRRGDP